MDSGLASSQQNVLEAQALEDGIRKVQEKVRELLEKRHSLRKASRPASKTAADPMDENRIVVLDKEIASALDTLFEQKRRFLTSPKTGGRLNKNLLSSEGWIPKRLLNEFQESCRETSKHLLGDVSISNAQDAESFRKIEAVLTKMRTLTDPVQTVIDREESKFQREVAKRNKIVRKRAIEWCEKDLSAETAAVGRETKKKKSPKGRLSSTKATNALLKSAEDLEILEDEGANLFEDLVPLMRSLSESKPIFEPTHATQ